VGQIRFTIGNKEIVLDTGRKRATPKRGVEFEKDEAAGWPSRERARAAILEPTGMRGKSVRSKVFDWNGCGAGSNSVRGGRAVVGGVRAISAAETGCLVASAAVEARLRAVMCATTKRGNDGMQVVR